MTSESTLPTIQEWENNKTTYAHIEPTDTSNAELFTSMFADRFRFDMRDGKFYVFTGHTFEVDYNREAFRATKSVIDQIALTAIASPEGKREKLLRWSIQSASRSKREAMLAIAATELGIVLKGDEWNTDPNLVGCENGVLNLVTGEFRPGKPEDMINKRMGTSFDPKAACPRFEKFLVEIFNGDTDLIEYVQRQSGYSMTGHVTEHDLRIEVGGGRNGKGTKQNVMLKIAGDYGHVLPFETLVKREGSGGVPNDIASLDGKRYVALSEASEGAVLNEGRVKSLTGGDRLSARYLHQEFFSFTPTFKLWIGLNDEPRINDSSIAMWQRVKKLPFTQQFGSGKGMRPVDKTLEQSLADELPGILNWLVAGAMQWSTDGIGEPGIVKVATSELQRTNDRLAEFIDEMLVITDVAVVRASEAFAAYSEWADKRRLNGYDRLKSRQFSVEFAKKFHKEKDRVGTFYIGVGISDGSKPIKPDSVVAQQPLTSPESNNGVSSDNSDAFSHTTNEGSVVDDLNTGGGSCAFSEVIPNSLPHVEKTLENAPQAPQAPQHTELLANKTSNPTVETNLETGAKEDVEQVF